MVKRALTLLTSILFALPLLMPFNIYGATWGDAPIIGINVYAIDYDYNQVPMRTSIITDTNQTRWHCASSHSSMGCQTWVSENTDGNTTSSITGNLYTQTYHDITAVLYKYEIVFDKSYVGRIHINWTNTSTTTVFSRYLYVNGESVEFTSTVYSDSFSIDSYTLEYTPLEIVNKMKNWNIPIESFSFVSSFFNKGFEEIGFNEFNDYLYPIFNVESNKEIISFWGSTNDKFSTYKMIFFIDRNIYSLQLLNQYFTLSNGQFLNFNGLNRFRYNNRTSYIISVEIGGFTSEGNKTITYSYSDSSSIIPIYFNYSSFNLLSTDFALNFGLTNQLLDDLHIIANGTVQSNSAAQSSDSANSQLQTDSNTLFQQENGFKSDMQNAMQNVNNTFRLQDMGTKFVSSAQWVRTQYENLTNNTPFASLITFSLITGLALILLGKVYK